MTKNNINIPINHDEIQRMALSIYKKEAIDKLEFQNDLIYKKQVISDLLDLFVINTDRNGLTSVHGVYDSLKE